MYCGGSAISRCLLEMGDQFESEHFDFEYTTVDVKKGVRRDYHYTPLPSFFVKVAYRVLAEPEAILFPLLEAAYLGSMRPHDIAYLWPSASVSLYRELRRRGIRIVKETVNAEERFRQRRLGEIYESHGLKREGVTFDSKGLLEQDELFQTSSIIFTPSPWVTASLVAGGVPESKLRHTSYAWEPRTFDVGTGERPMRDVPTFISVAFGSVRKGTIELLRAWAEKTHPAKLILVGPVDDEIRSIVDELSQRDDVQRLEYVDDLAPLYREADAYIMLSHEEGSPIVAYFALGAGLPVIGSTPVTSGIVTDGVQGFVREPDDTRGVAEAIDRLIVDKDLRARMSRAAREQGLQHTWEEVTRRRVQHFEALR